tara:strand:- start:865 stop:1158 length:294 start_codon:yes stop_codon:yes gene_type:complete
MAKIIKFVDAAGSDENLVPVGKLDAIRVTALTTVVCSFDNSDSGESPDLYTLTVVSGKSDEVALEMANACADGRGGVFTVSAAGHTDISTVAFSAGS